MLEKSLRLSESPDNERVLSTRTLLLHHTHIQNGRPKEAKCSFCSGDMAKIYTQPQEPNRPDAMDEDNRGDQEGTTPPTPSSWNYT